MTDTPFDPSRRRFFRSFAGDVLVGAAQALGAVDALRSGLADGATTYLSDPPLEAPPTHIDPDIGDAAFRYASPATLLVVDQRALPDRIVEVPVETAGDAARILGDMVVTEGPVTGQIAAIGLALTASRNAGSTGSVIRALLEGSANALRTARHLDRSLSASIDRMMARYRSLDPGASGAVIAETLRSEAAAIVDEVDDDLARLARAGAGVLPEAAGPVLDVLTHGATGPLATGRRGTAVGVIIAAHRAGRRIHVWVDETRPRLEGSRLTAWELARAGVPHTLIADAAAGHLIASARVDVVLVGGHALAANGDLTNTVGTYPLAVLAARHGVPFFTCATVSTVDRATPGGGVAIDEADPSEVVSIGGRRTAPLDTTVSNPAMDVTPAELITGIITDEGAVNAPYEWTLAEAMARRTARRSGERPGLDGGLSSG